MKHILIAALLGSAIAGAAIVVAPNREVHIIDGDTVTRNGTHYRLVGFDAPEQRHPRCSAEAALAHHATERMRQLFNLGATLEERPGNCAWGRKCAVALYHGRDVAEIMTEEGLAHQLICPGGRCPPRGGWCAP